MKTIVLALLIIACGGAVPVAGATCVAGSWARCASNSTAVFCENGKWVEFPCLKQCTPTNTVNADGGRDYPDAGEGAFCLLPNLDAGQPCPMSASDTFGYCVMEHSSGPTPAMIATCVGGTVTVSACANSCQPSIIKATCD